MYEGAPGWAFVLVIFGVYLAIQISFNLAKLILKAKNLQALYLAFSSSLISNLWLIASSLTAFLVFGVKMRVEIPRPYPDVPLILFALIICFFIMLIDSYLRLVVRRRLGQKMLVESEEALFLYPTTLGVWELAFFNLAVIKPVAFELFMRGLVLGSLIIMFESMNTLSASTLAVVITAIVEFILRPNPERLANTIILSIILSVVYLASVGGVISTVIVRLLASVLLSLYFVHLVIKASGRMGTDKQEEGK